MQLTILHVNALLILVKLFTTAAAAFGESRDWRFPRHITHPLVPCESEGYFGHPRDCRWFYRCHDIRSTGIYRRSYYQCDPRQMFISSKNRCEFSYVKRNSSDNCSLFLQDNLNEIENTSVKTPVVALPDDPLQDYITPPVHAVAGNEEKCILVVGDCENKKICWPPNSVEYGSVKRVCNKVYRRCSSDTTPSNKKRTVCIPKTVYNPAEFYCMSDAIFCKTEALPPGLSTPSNNANAPSPPNIINPPSPPGPIGLPSPPVTAKPPTPVTPPGPPYPPPTTRPTTSEPTKKPFTKWPWLTTTKKPFLWQTTTKKPFPWQTTTGKPFPWQTTTKKPFPWQTTTGKPFPWQTTTGKPFPWQTTIKKPFPWQTTTSKPFPWQTTTSKPFPWQTTTSKPFPWQTTTKKPFPWQTTTKKPFPWQTTTKKPTTKNPIYWWLTTKKPLQTPKPTTSTTQKPTTTSSTTTTQKPISTSTTRKPWPWVTTTKKPWPWHTTAKTTKNPIYWWLTTKKKTTTTTSTSSTTTTTTEKPTTIATTSKPIESTTTTSPKPPKVYEFEMFLGSKYIYCSQQNEVPFTDWMKKFYCEDYILCSPENRFIGKRTMCDQYFICQINSRGDGWVLQPMQCSEHHLYSIQSGYCQAPPSDDKLCGLDFYF